MANSALIPRLKTPGVYIEEIKLFPPSVAQVETAIPAFIGHTKIAKDLKDDDLRMKPHRITSMLEYSRYFGGPDSEKNITVTINSIKEGDNEIVQSVVAELPADKRSPYIMYYALQAFFANGGGPCYIVSVGGYTALEQEDDSEVFVYPKIDDVNLIGGKKKDAAGADIVIEGGLAQAAKIDEITLIVFPEEQGVNDEGKYSAIQNASLDQCYRLQDRFAIMSLYNSTSNINSDRDKFRNLGFDAEKVRYGASYYPNIETIFEYAYEEADVKIVHNVDTGKGNYDGETLKVLKDGREKTAVVEAIPKNTSLYNKAKTSIQNNIPCTIPPSAIMAGVYAAVDSSRGVWKAPANVSLKAVRKPVITISDADQADLNVDVTAGKSINAIRTFTGKGVLVWGARTLAGNDNEWRYIPVRRFFNMVEESVKKATAQFVFEPNDRNTWVKVRAMIENFLTLQWRAGALAGAVPEHAFFVRVGLGETMDALDILEGRMIVEIGMAAVRPAEFIILQFMHKMQES